MWKMLRTNADMRRLFIAQVVSYLGDWFSFVALVGLVDDLTNSSFLVSMVVVSFSLPSFLASPIAGVIVDRFDRRRVLIIVSLVQSVAALGLLLVGHGTVWLAFVCQSAISALAAIVKPATEAGTPNLARDHEELGKAQALFGSTWGVMLAVGAALGGFFAAALGRDAAFVINAVSFVLSAGLIFLVRRPLQEKRHQVRERMKPIADMREALGHARRDSVLLALLLSKTTFAVGSGVVSQLAVLASDVYGGGDGARGLLIAARGAGVGLGPIVATRFTGDDVSKVLMICGYASLAFSGFYLVGAWMPTLWLCVIFITAAHLGGGAQWTLSTYGLQLRSPDQIRGRILAGDFALVTLVLSVTSAAAGALSQATSVRTAITVFAVAAAGASLVYISATRNLRKQLQRRSGPGLEGHSPSSAPSGS